MTHCVDGLLSALWRASWQGTLVFALVWLACRLLARRLPADGHCWLWRLSYVKLLVGLVWGGAILVPLLAPAPTPPRTNAAPVVFAAHPAVSAQPQAYSANAALPAAAAPKAASPFPWQTALAAAYVMGVAVCLGRLLLALRRTRRVLRSAMADVSAAETACVAHLAQRLALRHIPPLARSPLIGSPAFVAGTVLLPSDVQFHDADLRMILAHELAHARRRDLAWEWLGTAVQTLFFFHPLVVLARREERLAREAAADALALEATDAPAADYGKLLLSLSLEQSSPRPLLAGAVGVIEGGSLLRRRLLALRDAASRTRRRKQWRVAVALVPLMALAFVPWQMTHGQSPAPALTSAPVSSGYPTMPVGDKEIAGVVVNASGKPVAGLRVVLIERWTQNVAGQGTRTGAGVVDTAMTDTQGRFIFSHLPAAQYIYQVSSPANRYVAVVSSLTLRKAEMRRKLHIAVVTGALVTGRAVDAQTGNPMPGILVEAGSGYVNTDAQGRYAVRVMPGNILVRTVFTTGGSLLSRRVAPAERQVRVRTGQTASVPDLRVFLRPVITCVGPDGQPVANTMFHITGPGGRFMPSVMEGATDNTGNIVLGQYGPHLSGMSGNFSIQKGPVLATGTFHWAPGQPLTITSGGGAKSYPSGVATVQLTEAAAAMITGKVANENGMPIANAVVSVFEMDAKSRYAVGMGTFKFKTDASGGFRAPVDPSEKYEVYARADGFTQAAVTDSPAAGGFGQSSVMGSMFTVVKGQTTDVGVVHLIPAPGYISGRVVDSSGKPMAGIVASVNGGKTFVSGAITDAQGVFRIPNVVPGESLHLILCLHGFLVDGDSGDVATQSAKQMDIRGVQASPQIRQIVWQPQPGR